ncbi:hypothetical protein VTJ83DRAFT_3468 [Remersonia thermophila]|uniref:CWH43-like N-terminal domain-containing protein n=1 Tax=Remersonia thermophila TaxID=72144 RepID=A0ABR4DG95_9PEZI
MAVTMPRLSYWILPVLASITWLVTLLVLLLYWLIHEDRVHYVSMASYQRIPFISDIGASTLKPLFVVACALTMLLLDLSLIADRWLRHRGRLAPNTSRTDKVLFGLMLASALAGTAGLILVSIFDTARWERLHKLFLLVFIAGFVLSAVFLCWEFRRLGKAHQNQPILRRSFYVKLLFVLVELVLAAGFIACLWTSRFDAGAVLEWIIAVIFSAYLLSFAMDLYPAAGTRTSAAATAADAEAKELSRDGASKSASGERLGDSDGAGGGGRRGEDGGAGGLERVPSSRGRRRDGDVDVEAGVVSDGNSPLASDDRPGEGPGVVASDAVKVAAAVEMEK